MSCYFDAINSFDKEYLNIMYFIYIPIISKKINGNYNVG